MGFDLSNAKSYAQSVTEREDKGVTVHLRDEKRAPMYDGDQPVTITVAGTYSKRYRRAMEALQDRRMRSPATADRESARRDALDVIAACVISWSGFYDGDKPAECNKPNAVKVLEHADWWREQIEAAMEDHAGFTGASSGS